MFLVDFFDDGQASGSGRRLEFQDILNGKCPFLDASSYLYMNAGPSVGNALVKINKIASPSCSERSKSLLVRPSVLFFYLSIGLSAKSLVIVQKRN